VAAASRRLGLDSPDRDRLVGTFQSEVALVGVGTGSEAGTVQRSRKVCSCSAVLTAVAERIASRVGIGGYPHLACRVGNFEVEAETRPAVEVAAD
jgi:hypothetical protein